MKSAAKTKYDRYKKILQEKAEEVGRGLSADRAAQIVSRLDYPSDEGDLSQQSHEEWIFLNRNSLDMSLLRQIQDALIRIADQSYGVCQDCDTPISTKRLEAVPWANYCVRCQDMHSTHNAWDN